MPLVKKITDAIQSGCKALSPNCREASRLQSEALDRKLSFPRRLGLWLHLLICKWCRRYGKQIRFLRGAARQCPDHLTEAVPQKLSAEARERILQRLESEK
jgi:hypothetical protein